MNSSLFSLEGKVALVTGGNGGIGNAIARGLRDAGAKIVVTGRNQEKNQAIAKELGGAIEVFTLDVREEAAVERIIAEIVEKLGRLDILVNNAGILRGGPSINFSRNDWDAVVETHITGSFLCSKYSARAMVAKREGGKIINIGSMGSIFGAPGGIAYATAKTGVIGLTRSLAIELAPDNIQVNAILPGFIKTDMTSSTPDIPREKIRQRTPAGRWGEPEELIGAAVFLASTASNFVTGVQLPVDGGYSVNLFS
jgi:2-deoxy-D-gluconate 3-dehydrogenase